MRRSWQGLLTLGALLLMVGRGEAVPVGLDAGAIAAGVDQDREWVPRPDEPDVRVDLGRPEEHAAGVRIFVKRIRVTGQDVLPESAMAALTAKYEGKELSFGDLQHAAATITDYFHVQGYMTAIAYLPEQEVIDGEVTIQVLPGRYGAISYDNHSALTTERAAGLAHAIRSEGYILRGEMDRVLLILNDVPGIRVHAYLSPGEKTGTADSRFFMETTERSGGAAYVDNYGSRFTGRWRIGGTYHWNNLTHVGDQLQIGYMQTFGARLHNYDVRYELPVGNEGTFGGIEYGWMDYRLGKEYTPYDATGSVQNWRLYTRTPGKRTLNNNIYWRLSVNHSALTDRIGAVGYEAKKHAAFIGLGFDGDYRTGKAASSYKVTHTLGWLTGDNDYARSAMHAADTAGLFQKTRAEMYHIQRLAPRVLLHLSLTGQYAWTNLDSSERLYIGGYNAVRAFPQGEAGGDLGLLGMAELRCQFSDPRWQIAAFYDAGWVRFRRQNAAGGENSRTLSGAGLGLIWTNRRTASYARLDYAFPLGSRRSETYGERIGGTWWFQFVQKI